MNDPAFPLESPSVREAIARADAERPLPLTTEYTKQLLDREQRERECGVWLAEQSNKRFNSYIGGGADEGKRGFDFDPGKGVWSL